MADAPLTPITAAIMRDDGGESPAFCVMAAFRTEAAARTALALITAPEKAPRPQNCGTGYCSCIECPFEKSAPKLDTFAFQSVLNAVQNFDISTGRARDLLDCWVAGTLTMDMLPQCEPWLFGEDEEPREVVGKLRADLVAAVRALEEATPSPPVAAPPATPVLWVSPKQLAALTDPEETPHGRYLPVRKTRAGLFTEPLYAQPQPQPAQPLTGALYVEVRECVRCNHIGINDSDSDLAACNTCGWSGPTPDSDHCPGCAATGTMTSACPKCGEQYRFVCDADLAGITAPSTPTHGDQHADR